MGRNGWGALALVVSLISGACGTGGAASTIRPAAGTASSAMHEGKFRVAEFGEPLIIDWKAHQRANLEEAMSTGVAVVAYTSQALTLLGDCQIDGSYGSLTVSPKEEVIALESADEIRANLPTFGSKLTIDFDGEMRRGSTLNLAVVVAGKKRTTVRAADRQSLRGSCDGATHFVRGVFMGAFALGTATRGSLQAGASLFGARQSGASSSTEVANYRDGDRSACGAVRPGAQEFPPGCSAPIRLELAPIRDTAGSPRPPAAPDARAVAPVCPSGLVLSAGRCAGARPGVVHRCAPGDVADCSKQCDAGDGASCWNLSNSYLWGDGVEEDQARSNSLGHRACDLGFAEACTFVASTFVYVGGNADVDEQRAVLLYEKAGAGGDPRAWSGLAYMYMRDPGVVDSVPRGVRHDLARGLALYEAGCRGGDGQACATLGGLYELPTPNRPLAVDLEKAASFYDRGCAGGDMLSCVYLGGLHASSRGSLRDAGKSSAAFRRACALGHAKSCGK